MSKKRLTKADREAQQRAALLRRVTDVYSGALGGEWDDEQWANAETLSLVIPALKELFGEQLSEGMEYVWGQHCLRYFDTAESATSHLFSAGIRA